MPGLFAMKRESWARLVRVSSLPRYAPSRRIAKGLSLSLSFFSLDHGRNNIAAARPRKRPICPFPTPLSLPTLERRASLITSGRNKRRPSPPDEFFPGVEWSGMERGGGYPRHLDPVSVHGTSVWPACSPVSTTSGEFPGSQGRISFFINGDRLESWERICPPSCR